MTPCLKQLLMTIVCTNQTLQDAEELAEYIIKTECTVREAAKKFSISKSTVHKDVTERLKNINSVYYFRVKRILEKNKSERHIRGGMATKRKYDVIKHVRERITEDYDI